MDNADLLTAACATADWVREEIRLEDLEVTIHQTRLETLRELLSRLEGKPKVRRGRPPRTDIVGESRSNIAEMPQRVPGSTFGSGHEVEPDTAA